MKRRLLSLGTIILLKENRGLRESIPRQFDKKSRVPEEKKGSEALEKEKCVWASQGEKDKCSFLHCFVLVNITMYLA